MIQTNKYLQENYGTLSEIAETSRQELNEMVMYTNLNAAAPNPDLSILQKGKAEIWYVKDEEKEGSQSPRHGLGADFRMGLNWLKKHDMSPKDVKDLSKTHTLLGKINATEKDLEKVFKVMQAEIWSPHGEANNLIKSLDKVHHTSMSVGDIVVINKKMYMVDDLGFVKL